MPLLKRRERGRIGPRGKLSQEVSQENMPHVLFPVDPQAGPA